MNIPQRVDAVGFCTANDSHERDPVEWRIYGANVDLRDAPEDGSVLAKSLDRLALQGVAGLRGPGARN